MLTSSELYDAAPHRHAPLSLSLLLSLSLSLGRRRLRRDLIGNLAPMTGRRRWTLDVALTTVVAFLVALAAGRIVAWMAWLLAWPGDDRLWWVSLPAAGAAIAVLVVAFARVTPATTEAYAHGVNHGGLAIGPAPSRFVALVSGVGVGAPLGPDEPMMYFGGSLGAFVARRTGRPERWCVLAGATAALAMVIGAPIAAALFASEVARRGVPRRRDRLPLAIGAVAAWGARRLSGDTGGVLGIDPGFTLSRVAVGALAIGGVAALVGRLFVPAIRAAKRVQVPLDIRVCVVLITLGTAIVVGWWATGEAIFLGPGERLRDWAVGASQPGLLAAALVFAVLVVAMVACGVIGGLFLPLLSLGSLLGVLIGRAWLPDVPYVACAGIGACSLLAAAHGTPFTAAAVAFATFGWSSTAWLAVVGVALASSAAGDHSVTTFQIRAVAAGHPLHRRAHRRSTR